MICGTEHIFNRLSETVTGWIIDISVYQAMVFLLIFSIVLHFFYGEDTNDEEKRHGNDYY